MKHLLLIYVLLLSANFAVAQTIVTHVFDVDQGGSTAPTQTPTITGSGPAVSSTDLTFVGFGDYNAGLGITNSNPKADGSNYLFVKGASVGTSMPATNTDYVGFTVSSSNGGTFNVTGASVQARTTGGAPAEVFFALRSSADNYATDLFTGSTQSTDFVTFAETNIASVTEQTSTEFRFYVWDNKANSTSPLRFDNLSVTLEAIPEPSNFALIYGILSAHILIRRRSPMAHN